MRPFRVVCIDDTIRRYSNRKPNLFDMLTKGEIYTVTDIITSDAISGYNEDYYKLAGKPKDSAYVNRMFRPIDDSFAEWVESTLMKEVELEEALK